MPSTPTQTNGPSERKDLSFQQTKQKKNTCQIETCKKNTGRNCFGLTISKKIRLANFSTAGSRLV